MLLKAREEERRRKATLIAVRVLWSRRLRERRTQLLRSRVFSYTTPGEARTIMTSIFNGEANHISDFEKAVHFKRQGSSYGYALFHVSFITQKMVSKRYAWCKMRRMRF